MTNIPNYTIAVFDSHNDLPEPARSAMLKLADFICDLDGKTIATPIDDHSFADEGTIHAEDAVKAFNVIVGLLRKSPDTAEAPAVNDWTLNGARRLLAIRDALVADNVTAAYHWLIKLIDPDFDVAVANAGNHWADVERAAALPSG